MRHLSQPEKSVVAEHSMEAGCRLDYNSISILEKVMRYVDHNVEEAVGL
jgi:hypothetical protein